MYPQESFDVVAILINFAYSSAMKTDFLTFFWGKLQLFRIALELRKIALELRKIALELHSPIYPPFAAKASQSRKLTISVLIWHIFPN